MPEVLDRMMTSGGRRVLASRVPFPIIATLSVQAWWQGCSGADDVTQRRMQSREEKKMRRNGEEMQEMEENEITVICATHKCNAKSGFASHYVTRRTRAMLRNAAAL